MIHQFELPIIETLQSWGASMQPFWKAITILGDETFYLLFMPLVYWCVNALAGLRIGVMLLLSASTNSFFKIIFKSPRPYWLSDKIKPGAFHDSFGLPSGHAQNSAAVWGWTAKENDKTVATWILSIMIFLIGLSRIFLGVHFISDVLLGWAIGAVLVSLFAHYSKNIGQSLLKLSLAKKLLLTALGTLLMIAFPALVKLISNAWQVPAEWIALAGKIDPMNLKSALTTAGVWFGMLAGFSILLHQKGVLQSHLGSWQKLVRFLIGIVGVFALYAGLGKLFQMEMGLLSMVLRFIRYSLIGFWVSWWSPLLFQKIGIGQIEPHQPEQVK